MKSTKRKPCVALGMPVELKHPNPTVRFKAITGVIARRDKWDGYVIVKLDQPASYERADGEVEELAEIRVADDDLVVIDPHASR